MQAGATECLITILGAKLSWPVSPLAFLGDVSEHSPAPSPSSFPPAICIAGVFVNCRPSCFLPL